MPHQVTSEGKSKGKPNLKRARQYLSGVGVARDDSDDELGLVDHPWKWVYAKNVPDEEQRRGKKKKARAGTFEGSQTIVGARMGTFECRLGDSVFLKADGANSEAWIGIICNFEEDEEDEQKCANFMWFSTEKEIRNKQKKRTDTMPVSVPLLFRFFCGPLSQWLYAFQFEHSLKGKSTFYHIADLYSSLKC